MRMIIFATSVVMLISCAIMMIMQKKEKKRIISPYMILFGITFFVALFTLIKMLGVLL